MVNASLSNPGSRDDSAISCLMDTNASIAV
jgi:hypothetical protein